ncbi:MAG: HPP family protein [Bauldia sp.]
MTVSNRGRQRVLSLIGPLTSHAPLYGFGVAALAILVTGGISRLVLGDELIVPLLASMGSSAVLLFIVPSSPMAQPWALVGGNLLAALSGLVASLVADPILGCAIALGLSIGLMGLLRCVHPPSAALGMTIVLNSARFDEAGIGFLLALLLLNTSLLLVLATLFHNLILRRPYPHRPPPANIHGTDDPIPTQRGGVTHEDIDTALRQFPEALDVNPVDVEELIERAEARAYQRRTGDLRAADIMSRDVASVAPTAGLRTAYDIMREHRVTALPVVENGRVIGVLTASDVIDRLPPPDAEDIGVRAAMRKPAPARLDTPVADLVPALSDADVHLMPVVDIGDRLLGVVTQSDLVAALYRAAAGPSGPEATRPG